MPTWIIIAPIATAPLLALCAYIYLAYRGNSAAVLATSNREIPWPLKIFLGMAAIGLGICLYSGAERMLSWMPNTWGGLDESGDFKPLGSSLAMMFALYGGYCLIEIIDKASQDRLALEVMRTTVNGERAIHAAHSATQVNALKAKYQAEVNELRKGLPPLGPYGPPKGWLLRAYLDLIRVADARLAQWN